MHNSVNCVSSSSSHQQPTLTNLLHLLKRPPEIAKYVSCRCRCLGQEPAQQITASDIIHGQGSGEVNPETSAVLRAHPPHNLTRERSVPSQGSSHTHNQKAVIPGLMGSYRQHGAWPLSYDLVQVFPVYLRKCCSLLCFHLAPIVKCCALKHHTTIKLTVI